MYWLIVAAADAVDQASSSLPELPPMAQYGVLGTLIAALASGRFLVPRYVYDQQKERADKMEQENLRLNTLIADKTIPAIVDAASVVRDSLTLLDQMKRERDIQEAAQRRNHE